MTTPKIPDTLRLFLVSDESQRQIEAAVEVSCPPPHLVSKVDTSEQEVERAMGFLGLADAILVAWQAGKNQILGLLMRKMRKTNVPLIAICDPDPEAQVAALLKGADDVMVMPIYLPLLQARLLAWRRGHSEPDPALIASEPEESDLVAGPIRIDRRAQRVYLNAEEVEFSPKEQALLSYLMQHAGECMTRDEILDEVWGIGFDTGTNMVDVYMFFLRKKLKAHKLDTMLQTVRGRGYRLVVDPV